MKPINFANRIITYHEATGQYVHIDIDGRVLNVLTIEETEQYKAFKQAQDQLNEQANNFTELLFG